MGARETEWSRARVGLVQVLQSSEAQFDLWESMRGEAKAQNWQITQRAHLKELRTRVIWNKDSSKLEETKLKMVGWMVLKGLNFKILLKFIYCFPFNSQFLHKAFLRTKSRDIRPPEQKEGDGEGQAAHFVWRLLRDPQGRKNSLDSFPEVTQAVPRWKVWVLEGTCSRFLIPLLDLECHIDQKPSLRGLCQNLLHSEGSGYFLFTHQRTLSSHLPNTLGPAWVH